MDVKVIPDSCKGENKKFEGFVVLKPMNFDNTFELMEVIGYDVDSSGKIVEKESSGLKRLRNLVKFSESFYKEVNIKKADGSKEYKSFKDLSEDSECIQILVEIASGLSGGNRLGNG